MDKSSPRARLRAETSAWHDRVDALYSGFDLDDAGGYAQFLIAQARVYLPIEAALTTAGAGDLLPGWTEARRAVLLLDDLAALDCPAPAGEAALSAFATPAAVLGGLYVLEGSRLGGSLIARSLPSERPQRFLSARHPELWRRLIEIIDARLTRPDDMAQALDAARHVFDLFAASGEQQLKAA